jgi:hypothetical protein
LVKIAYKPWEEIIIHEIVEKSPEELFVLLVRQIQGIGSAGMQPAVTWAEGIAFTIAPLPDTEEVIAEQLEGKLHYSTVQFARVPTYHAEMKCNVDRLEHTIQLIKVETPMLIQLAKYLKDDKWKE